MNIDGNVQAIGPAGLYVKRMASIQCRIQDIWRMSTFAQREFDGILFVRFSSSVISLIQLEGDMWLSIQTLE